MKEVIVDRTKISLILNYIIFALVVFATIIMFTGYKITFLQEPALETSGLAVLKFFTVDSNLLMGIAAILLAHKERKLLTGKIKDIPVGYYLLKYMATVSVAITFLVVFIYLGRIVNGGVLSLLQNSNIFFHLVIPLLGALSFLVFERTKKIKLSYIICSVIPILLYGIYYIINILCHVEKRAVSPKYDWYWFTQNGIKQAYTIAVILFFMTLIVGFIMWAINRKGK